MPIARIAAQLGAERKTIRHWLALGRAPTWAKPPRRGGVLLAYWPHLDQRWAEGCNNAALLWREVSGLGFTGAYSTVRGWARRRRVETNRASDGKALRGITGEPPSRRQTARLLKSEPDAVPEGDRAFLAWLLAQVPALGEPYGELQRQPAPTPLHLGWRPRPRTHTPARLSRLRRHDLARRDLLGELLRVLLGHRPAGKAFPYGRRQLGKPLPWRAR